MLQWEHLSLVQFHVTATEVAPELLESYSWGSRDHLLLLIKFWETGVRRVGRGGKIKKICKQQVEPAADLAKEAINKQTSVFCLIPR